jgi:AcrR family transcriptional regulator
MAQTRRSTEERREEIADAALRIIATRGLSSLTVAVLAEELGVTGGALYRHFPSTAAILDAVAARAAELLDGTFPDPDLPPLEWLERFVLSRVEAVSGHAGLSRLLLSEQVAMAMPPRALEHLLGAAQKTFLGVEQAIRRGQADGSIRSDVTSYELTPIVMGTVQMLALTQSGGLLRGMIAPEAAWSTLETLLRAPKVPSS